MSGPRFLWVFGPEASALWTARVPPDPKSYTCRMGTGNLAVGYVGSKELWTRGQRITPNKIKHNNRAPCELNRLHRPGCRVRHAQHSDQTLLMRPFSVLASWRHYYANQVKRSIHAFQTDYYLATISLANPKKEWTAECVGKWEMVSQFGSQRDKPKYLRFFCST